MRFLPTSLPGVFVVEPELREDERGFFARTLCREEFATAGLFTIWPQCNISFNRQAGTLRGMHWQAAPHEEVKLVRCTMGAAYDVVLDLRRDSPTFKKWAAFEITAENRRAIYIPADCAHGFQTLADNTELFYHMGESYHAESARGVRWDDPAFGIVWPSCERRVIAERDLCFPDFTA
jgi:dTDP-4-dehydrorhamnose 3,5-epimerase